MADKPLSRQEVAWDWMVEDARDIMASMESARAQLAELGKAVVAVSEDHKNTLESDRQDLIKTHRELQRLLKDNQKRLSMISKEASKKLEASVKHSGLTLIACAFLSAAAGGFIGTFIAIGAVMYIG